VETPGDGLQEIPCVLGACYSMSKRYWDYIKGLSMLRYYGADEAYLSLKVWLEGGRCLLIGDVVAGHLFRTVEQRPYDAWNIDMVYNKLLIAETVLPEKYARFLRDSLKAYAPDYYYAARMLMNARKTEIEALKAYYRTIFTRDLASFKAFNALHAPPASAVPDFVDIVNADMRIAAELKTDEIAAYLMKNPTLTAGLLVGGLGEIIFLYRYARSRGDVEMKAAIDNRLFEMLDTADVMRHYNVMSGAAGTGLGLIYLREQGFVDIDIARVLSPDMDGTLLKHMYRDIEKANFGLLQGAAGLGYYFLRRGNPKYLSAVEMLTARFRRYAARDAAAGVPLCISDGLSGSLLFLCEAYRKNVPAAGDAVKEMVDCILRQEQDARKYGSMFPPVIGTPGKNGLTADSGDTAVGFAILHAGNICDCRQWREKGIGILLSAVGRRDPVQELVQGAGLAKGLSGIAAIWRAAYRQTGTAVFREAAGYWTKQTLYMSMEGLVPAGYKAYGSTGTEHSLSLLKGITGIGLVLLENRTV
jgi:hypothetical protein